MPTTINWIAFSTEGDPPTPSYALNVIDGTRVSIDFGIESIEWDDDPPGPHTLVSLDLIETSFSSDLFIKKVDDYNWRIDQVLIIPPIYYEYVIKNQVYRAEVFSDIPDEIDLATKMEPDPALSKTEYITLEAVLEYQSTIDRRRRTYAFTIENRWDGDKLALDQLIAKEK